VGVLTPPRELRSEASPDAEAAAPFGRLSEKSPESNCTLARVARLLIAASALHTIAWIYYNTIPWPYG